MREQRAERAAIYLRVSTRAQDDEGTSLETQEARCRDYSQEHAYRVDDAHVYREVHSGADVWGRPALSEMRALMRAGEYDVIVAYALDRLSRNQDHLGLIVSEAERAGVRLEFVTEKWDETPVGKFMRSALSFTAEVERLKILERTDRGRRNRVAQGKPLGGRRPMYGYKWNDDHSAYVINEPEAVIVRRIFAEVADGVSLHKVALRLSADRVPIPWPTKQNTFMWYKNSVGRICHLAEYWGQPTALRTRRTTKKLQDRLSGAVRTAHVVEYKPREEHVPMPTSAIPPIVDPALAAEALRRIEYNRVNVRRPVIHPLTLLQSGYGVCGVCGGPLRVRRRAGEGRAAVYTCGRRNENRAYPCTSHAMITPMLDEAVWAEVARVLRDPKIIADEVEKRASGDTTGIDLETVDRRLAEIGREQANLAEIAASLSSPVAAAPLVEKLSRLAEEKERLQGERAHVQERHDAWRTSQGRLRELSDWCRTVSDNLDALTLEHKRDALFALGIKVKLYPKDHIPRWKIEANIPFDDVTIVTNSVMILLPLSTMRAASLAFSGG